MGKSALKDVFLSDGVDVPKTHSFVSTVHLRLGVWKSHNTLMPMAIYSSAWLTEDDCHVCLAYLIYSQSSKCAWHWGLPGLCPKSQIATVLAPDVFATQDLYVLWEHVGRCINTTHIRLLPRNSVCLISGGRFHFLVKLVLLEHSSILARCTHHVAWENP